MGDSGSLLVIANKRHIFFFLLFTPGYRIKIPSGNDRNCQRRCPHCGNNCQPGELSKALSAAGCVANRHPIDGGPAWDDLQPKSLKTLERPL